MPKNILKTIKDTAEELHKLRRSIDEKEEAFKLILSGMKQRRNELQDFLLKELNKNDISSIKVTGGDTFFKAKQKGVEITNELRAFDWAYKNKAVSINKIIVKQLLKEIEEMPPGFQLVETEYIGVRKSQKKELISY